MGSTDRMPDLRGLGAYSNGKLKLDDLWEIRTQDSSAYLWNKWNHKIQKDEKKSTKSSILYELLHNFKVSILIAGGLKILEQILIFAGPLVANLVIGYKVEENGNKSQGYFYVILLLIVSTIKIIIGNQYLYRTGEIGMRVRSLLCNQINSKLLRLSSEGLTDLNMGEVVNMTVLDAQSIGMFCSCFHMLWGVPAQILVALYFQWNQLGLPVIAGFITLVSLMILDLKLAGKARSLFQLELKTKDSRLKTTTEVLTKIKEIKMSAFELIYQSKILESRKEELNAIRHSSYLRASTDFIWTFAPILVSLVTFTTYLWMNQEKSLGPNQVFVYLMLFQIMEPPLKSIPAVVQGILQANVGTKRLEKLLNASEIEQKFDNCSNKKEQNLTQSFVLTNASFEWKTEQILKNIDLKIEKGSLIGIVGRNGSGKSSFLSALLGQMKQSSGSVVLHEQKFSYVPQNPWLLRKTLKDNIIMSEKYNAKKIFKIIHACELEQDIAQMPNGTETMIGESGSSLSGGQKQRISLARALYYDGQLFLVDNIMNALDPKVRQTIFYRVFGSEVGLLKAKTRFLVTNNMEYLKKVDVILLVQNQTITRVDYSEIEGTLVFLDSENSSKNLLEIQETESRGSNAKSIPKAQKLDEKSSDSDLFAIRKRKDDNKIKAKKIETSQNLLKDEEKLKNENPSIWVLFYKYVQFIGIPPFIGIVIFYLICQGFMASSNMWLSKWTAEEKNNSFSSSNSNLMIYAGLGIAQGLTGLLAILTLEWGILRAAHGIHLMMIETMLKAPLSYFSTLSSGQVINNFSKDLEVVDKSMSPVIGAWIKGILALGTTIFLASLTNPLFIISTTVPLVLLCSYVQRFWAFAFRELRDIDAGTLSELFSHLKSTLEGISSIQAFKIEKNLQKEFYTKMDQNIVSFHASTVTHRLMAVCLEFIGMIFLGLVGFSGIFYMDSMSPGMIGLLLTQGFQVVGSINNLAIVSCSLETHLSSVVKRLFTYFHIPSESMKSQTLGQNFKIKHGSVQFHDYFGRYGKNLNTVLYEITTKIESGEKIGIVGRTGAGKSSIFLAILRLLDTESENGWIEIDNFDIGSINPTQVRRAITVIPQTPLILNTTIRKNVDPWNLHTDLEIWDSLLKTKLMDFVQKLPETLNYIISNENGDKFSARQKILLSFARGLLNKSKLILLDESTSSIDDFETQVQLEEVIENEFKPATVLTITHNYKSDGLLNYSRIMVIEEGHLVEIDSPRNLLSNPASILYNQNTH